MKKTAIITGGAGGIGFGIALQLANDGCNIALFDIMDESAIAEKIAQICAAGSDTLYYRGNIAQTVDCYAFTGKVIEKYGSIDVLVNNAGVAPKVRADMLETTEESLDYVFGINIKGTGGVPNRLILFCRFVAFSFDGADMEELGPFKLFKSFEDTNKLMEVVSVYHPKVAESHRCKEGAFAKQRRFGGFYKFLYHPA
jgi:NAD(P)-dependent dehydrogenase (short-subunit alcohol dehydrogenase family)